MCAIISHRIRKQTNKVLVAWKCIAENSGKAVWYPLCQSGTFRRGVWQKAQGEVGFNCYTTKELARNSGWSTSNRPVKVQIRKVEGYNADRSVVFAREILVPRG